MNNIRHIVLVCVQNPPPTRGPTGELWRKLVRLFVAGLFVLAITEGTSEDGSAEGSDGGSFGGFAAFVVADDCAEEAAEHRASSRTAFGVVHGAGAADEHAGGEGEKDEFVFHNFSVF